MTGRRRSARRCRRARPGARGCACPHPAVGWRGSSVLLDHRGAAGRPVRTADLRELGDRPACGGDRRRRSPPIEAENALLQPELDYLRSDAFVGAEARRLANLGQPGEQLLIIPPGAEAPLPEEIARLQRPKPLLEQWVELFFGRRAGLSARRLSRWAPRPAVIRFGRSAGAAPRPAGRPRERPR